MTDFTVGRLNGYRELRKRIGTGRITDLKPELFADVYDEFGKLSVYTGMHLMAELYETYGYLPYVGDRHTAEFLSFTLSGDVERYPRDNRKGMSYDTLRYCDIKRTSVAYNRLDLPGRQAAMRDMIAGTRPLPGKSLDTVAEMVRAHVQNQPFVDAVNVVNVGQMPGLPSGPCVETMGIIDGLGVHPVTVPSVPSSLLELLRPPALASSGRRTAPSGTTNPCCCRRCTLTRCAGSLKPHEVRAMASELMEANRALATP